jgi:hypothetical protein
VVDCGHQGRTFSVVYWSQGHLPEGLGDLMKMKTLCLCKWEDSITSTASGGSMRGAIWRRLDTIQQPKNRFRDSGR